jgi:cell migration-inducing and hyaluronan-binding protein
MQRLALAFAVFVSTAVWAAAATPKPWIGNFPTTGAVTIPAGQTVILDTDVNLTSLTIDGELICADKDLAVKASWIAVHGLLRCGTAAVPYTKQLELMLTGADAGLNIMGMGQKFLGAMGGGRVELHGENRLGWTRLAATANIGATQITLKQTPGWRVNDRIVIVSTDYRADHAEERRIAAISGATITLDSPLLYQHWCASEVYGPTTLEQCAEVGLLTRNIVLRGDALSTTAGFGGHLMFMAGSSAKISGVQFLNMGQKGKIGRYPMHWHMVGPAPGQYLTNSSIVHSYNRFVSVHGTHNIRLAGNVAYDTIGHGYYLEDGIERGNVIEDNLGVLARNAADGLPTPSDRTASVFWISNPDNVIRRNVSAGSEHTGFWLGFPEHPIGLSATNTIWPRRTPLRYFSDNVSHSNSSRGLYVDGAEKPDRTTTVTWFEPRQIPSDSTSPVVPPVFRNFTAYKNRFEGIWLRSFSRPVLQSVKLADNWMGAYFASLSGVPGLIQDSLVVGETANKGNPASWETKGLDGRELPLFWEPAASIRGLEFYDGPMQIRRTLFANFVPNTQRKSGGLTNLSPNPFRISSTNSALAVTFQNANRVWLDPITPNNNGDGFSAFIDADGSVTGTAGRRIVPKNPVLYTSSCVLRAEWNAYVCPHNYVGVQLLIYDSAPLAGLAMRRDDGATHGLGVSDQYPQYAHWHLLENRPHELVMPIVAPKRLSFIRNEQPGKAVRVSLPYPTGSYALTLWGTPIAKSTSLSDLTFGGTKHYYDTVTKRLHLRLVSTDGTWQIYEVTRP